MKVYDKKKAQSPLWTENIDYYMPILLWLNENTKLNGRIVRPLKTNDGAYRFDDDENVYLLFDFIKGEPIGKALTHTQLLEAADIMACLHSYDNEIPINTDRIRKDFSVPFCYSLERFISESYSTSPADIINSNLIIDARNGFEDEKEDVEWGFTVLLPAMSKTSCKVVVFIIEAVNDIKEEMDMRTAEFTKCFKVYKVDSYQKAIDIIS